MRSGSRVPVLDVTSWPSTDAEGLSLLDCTA